MQVSEGRFFRMENLNIHSICGGAAEICKERVYLGRPEVSGGLKKTKLSAGAGVATT